MPAATKTRRTPAAVLTVTDAPADLAPEPFTVTGDLVRLTINSWDGQLVADLVTGEVRIVSTLLAAGADDLPLGTGQELQQCYRAHVEPSIDAYAAHLTALLRNEAEAGLL